MTVPSMPSMPSMPELPRTILDRINFGVPKTGAIS